jgi:hypothetical protein
MALNIFRSAEEQAPQRQQYDDVVGSFRAGFLEGTTPKSLDEWRVTTGDPEVADAIHKLLGGEKPSKWETKGEENLEVYTEAKSVTVILENSRAVRQRFIQRNRSGEIVYTSDGAMKDDGERDPHASLTLDERLKLASDGLGPSLETTIWFRLDDSMGDVTLGGQHAMASDLGKFRYSSTGKSIGKQVDRDQIEAQLHEDFEDKPVRAKLTIEHISFVAKSGPRAGKTVEYNTAKLIILGAAA